MIKEKIVLIAPFHPYRGGIAHFNDCLASSLEKKYDLTKISWKKRYPKFLYPGNNQFDEDKEHIIKNNKVFLLSYYNPLSWISAIIKIKKSGASKLVLNWVTPFLAPPLFCISFITKVFLKLEIVLLCHNVKPHEQRFFDKFLSKIVFSTVNKFIVHADEEKKHLQQMKPDSDIIVGFHPNYTFFQDNRTVSNLREKLNLTPHVILFFGYVREYKGLKYLIKAMPEILESIPDCHLLIVGEFWNGSTDYLKLIDQLDIKENITIIDSYVPNEEVGNYFECTNLVVLPYISATQSGIAKIAFSFNKSVITTKVGGLKEIDKEGEAILINPESSTEIAYSVIDYFENPDHGNNFSKSKSWDDYANLI